MIPWWVGVIAFMVGGFLGILTASLLAAAKIGDLEAQKAHYREELLRAWKFEEAAAHRVYPAGPVIQEKERMH